MTALLGLVLAHLSGAALVSLSRREPLRQALRRPTAAWLALAALHLASLGPAGWALLALGVAVAALLLRTQHEPPAALSGRTLAVVAVVAVVVLARPWVPTQWDELVWLGKARLVSLGFGEVVRASLDPGQHLVPAGYPTLFPSAVGWLTLGSDSLSAYTLAASLLVLLSAAAAIDAWAPLLCARPPVGLVALGAALAAPLAWVHLRSAYVDLPVGLLGLALLGRLLKGVDTEALALAVALAGLKDEGLVHVLAATAAALLTTPRRARAPVVVPALAAVAVTVTWRTLCSLHGVAGSDHALAAPYWPWLPTLGSLLWLHATDVFSWGLFWAVALAVLLQRVASREEQALKGLVLANVVAIALILLCGTERVRAFAENGTLVNRLLVQAWPGAALLVALALGRDVSSAAAEARPRAPAPTGGSPP